MAVLLYTGGFIWTGGMEPVGKSSDRILFKDLPIGFGRAYAEESATPETVSDDMIKITSQSLVYDRKGKLAEFIGNVKAVQGSSIVMSDRLSIHIDRNSKTGFPGSANENGSSHGKVENGAASDSPEKSTEPTAVESIEKIVAEGNVVITTSNMKAVTDKAVYTTKNRMLVLTGKNSRIENETEKGEKNSVKGSKIVFNAEDGIITVGDGNNPVEAIIHPDGKGLDLQ